MRTRKSGLGGWFTVMDNGLILRLNECDECSKLILVTPIDGIESFVEGVLQELCLGGVDIEYNSFHTCSTCEVVFDYDYSDLPPGTPIG